MNEMVERVAKAMQKRAVPCIDWDDLHEDARRAYLIPARSAIEAMREPTGEMRDAGAGVYDTIAGQPSRTWRAMIDEALK